jgi:hypothetical protein
MELCVPSDMDELHVGTESQGWRQRLAKLAPVLMFCDYTGATLARYCFAHGLVGLDQRVRLRLHTTDTAALLKYFKLWRFTERVLVAARKALADRKEEYAHLYTL